MNIQKQLTTIQTAAILTSSIIGVGVLPLPLFAARAAGSAGPLITAGGAAAGFLGVFILIFLGRRFQNQSIIQYSPRVIGKPIAFAGSMLIILFFAVLTSLAAREFGTVVVTSVLRKTPLEVTVIVMLLLAAKQARKDIRIFAYTHLLYLPFILAPGLIIVILSLKNAEWLYLQPIWGTEWKRMGTGVLTVAALFQGSFIIGFLIPYMRRPERSVTAGFWGVSIAACLYLLIVIAAIGVFGAEEIKNLLWPTLELAKTTSLPANILERLDAAFIAVWVAAVFTTLYVSYFLTILAMSQLFRLKDHKALSFAILPVIFVIAMLPQSVAQLYEVIEWVGRFGLLITIAYPAFLLLVASIRRAKGESNSNAPAR